MHAYLKKIDLKNGGTGEAHIFSSSCLGMENAHWLQCSFLRYPNFKKLNVFHDNFLMRRKLGEFGSTKYVPKELKYVCRMDLKNLVAKKLLNT